MILSAIAEKLKRRSKNDFKGRHFEATLILQAISWYERSPIQHHLVLHRVDPDQRMARFYALMIERDLFGTIWLVRNWGWIGTNGQELAEVFATEIEAPVGNRNHRPGRALQLDFPP